MTPSHTVCIAPMMRRSDRHFRYLMRLLSRHMMLYSEMIGCQAMLHGDRDALLRYNEEEHPLALQLGGREPRALGECARLASALGFDEINLNTGCPSSRVQAAGFGACLMADPQRVADCVSAMGAAATIPVTVKCRTGLHGNHSFQTLCHFIDTVAKGGCTTFIVHAREAVLEGLSPAENRTIPPLRPDWVYRLQQQFPALSIILNGGVDSMDKVKTHLAQVQGVMIGRAAYETPWFLSAVDQVLHGAKIPGLHNRRAVLSAYLPYVEARLDEGVPIIHCLRHLTGFFKGLPDGRQWRRLLNEGTRHPRQRLQAIREAMKPLPATGPEYRAATQCR